jgi:hypothetical protein
MMTIGDKAVMHQVTLVVPDVGVLWLVGTVTGILAVGGLLGFYFDPDKSKDICVIIGPIISAGITGAVAFLSGERSARK